MKLAGCVIKDKQGRILLLHRNTGKHKQWETPGGKIDVGETADQAAKREIKEELGVSVDLGEKIGKADFMMGQIVAEYTWFSANIKNGKPKIMEPETFDQLCYFSLEEMRDMHELLSPNAQNLILNWSEL